MIPQVTLASVGLIAMLCCLSSDLPLFVVILVSYLWQMGFSQLSPAEQQTIRQLQLM